VTDVDDLSGPLSPNPRLSSQPAQKWSYHTLRAIRPIPQHHTRAYAEDWNRGFPPGDALRVNLAEFPEMMPERSPDEIEENLQWLMDWGNGIHRPRPF
jgi:hypothetical protein